MASAAAMRPSRNSRHHADDIPPQTPVMRLESIFERTTSESPPLLVGKPAAAVTPFGSQHQAWQTAQRAGPGRESGTAVDQKRDVSPPPRDSAAAPTSGDTARQHTASPSPEPLDISSSGSSGDENESLSAPDGRQPADRRTQRPHTPASARLSPLGGAVSMSLDPGPLRSPAPPGAAAGAITGGYRLAGRSPSPLRRFERAASPAASAFDALRRRRDSSAVSMSIVREVAPGGRAGSRARSGSMLCAPSGVPSHPV